MRLGSGADDAGARSTYLDQDVAACPDVRFVVSGTPTRAQGMLIGVAGNPIRLLGTGHGWTSNPAGMLEPATANERRTTYV